ncbi:glycosyltransferase family A protein [uncultured Pedobacter sp.]|uniref:glycosyltransferase family A protein n=1 Tax=uncultured Pedobacter sp. TaxID=246139 RepID=UPI0025E94190|nr:glycosyltransferase family A protein [uncultured Pedobacter sp.]
MTSLGVSVIICCYNSSSRIGPTLKHLALQEFDRVIDWEIILVDNTSADGTAEKARLFWKSFNNNYINKLKVVYESTQGLSYAREKGILEANYDFLLFCDDDNWLCPTYIQTVFDLMSTHDSIAALGGCGTAFFEIVPPEFVRLNPGPYAVGPQSENDGYLSPLHTLYGAGTSYRKSALAKLRSNGFNFYLSGRLGNKLLNGEDRELNFALTLLGFKSYYCSKLTFTHFINAERSTTKYYFENLKGNSYSFYILHAYYLTVLQKFQGRGRIKISFIWNFLSYNIISLKNLFSQNYLPTSKKIQFWFLTNKHWIKNLRTYLSVRETLSNQIKS